MTQCHYRLSCLTVANTKLRFLHSKLIDISSFSLPLSVPPLKGKVTFNKVNNITGLSSSVPAHDNKYIMESFNIYGREAVPLLSLLY